MNFKYCNVNAFSHTVSPKGGIMKRTHGLSVTKDKLLAQGYNKWMKQRERCNNPNSAAYKHYGARGIRVKYGALEFTEWHKSEILKKKLKSPSVNRIDNDGHYEFGNIELIELSDNVLEMRSRNAHVGTLRKEVVIYDYATGKKITKCSSIKEAANFANIPAGGVSLICNKQKGRKKTRDGLSFRFIDE